jgi:hypothetical protein
MLWAGTMNSDVPDVVGWDEPSFARKVVCAIRKHRYHHWFKQRCVDAPFIAFVYSFVVVALPPNYTKVIQQAESTGLRFFEQVLCLYIHPALIS